MMRLRQAIILILSLTCALGAAAQSKYDNAKVKAERFFHYEEWGSAAAMCNLMIAEHPELAEPYGRGIVAYEMMGDTLHPMELLDKAMRYGVPLDSVLSGVKNESFANGRGSIYEQFMLQASRQYPWMERPLDAYLLRYYALRQNGPEMIEYAKKMLRGAPRNTAFLLTLANGYMLEDEQQKAIETWEKILDIAPRNFDALLCMANISDLNGNLDESLRFFRRAFEVKATPYVSEKIKELENRR